MHRSSMTWVSTLGFLCLSLALWIRTTHTLPLDTDWSDARDLLAVSRLGHSPSGSNDDDRAVSSGGQSAEEDPLDEPMYRVRRVPLSLLMKRALSLFTQWRPMQGTSGANRYAAPPGSDFVSAVARDSSRPRGQPLRWG